MLNQNQGNQYGNICPSDRRAGSKGRALRGVSKGGNPLWKKFVGIPKGMTIPFEKTPQDEPFHFGIYRLKILFNIIFDITFINLLFA